MRFHFTAITRHPLFAPILGALAMLLLAAFVEPSFIYAAPFAFGSLTESQHTGEFILSEQNGQLSRDTVTVTVPANTTFEPGHVLGQLSATGKYVEYDNSGSDGSEEGAAVLYGELVNDTGAPVDKTGVVINFGAEVRTDDLQWKSGLTDNDKAAGRADLAGKFIKCRS